MMNGRNLQDGTLLPHHFPRATLDLRRENLVGAFRTFTGPGDGYGIVTRSMTSAQRDALVTDYATRADPETGATPDTANGAIIYNATTNQLEARIGGVWVDLGAAGAANSLQGAYNVGATILETAGQGTFAITDPLVAAAGGVSLTKTGIVGAGATGRAFQVASGVAHAGTYRGFEFASTVAGGTQEGFRASMAAAADNALHVTLGAILSDSGDLTLTAGNALLSAGTYTQTHAANATSHLVTNNTATTAIVNSMIGTGVMTGAGRMLRVQASGATTASVFEASGAAITTGTIARLTGGAVAAGGAYLRANDGAADVFLVGVAGATTIAGVAAGTPALTLTAGDVLVSSGDLTVSLGALNLTQDQAAESAIAVTANGARTISGVTFTSSGSSALGTNSFHVSNTGAVVLAGAAYGATWANTAAATGAMFLGTLSGAAAHSARIFDAVVSSATATTGDAYRVTFSAGAHTGHAFDAVMGTNLAGNGLRIARSGVATGSAIVVTHAGASTSAGGPDFDLDGTNTATTWIGARIRNAVVALATGRVLEVAQRGTGASTANTLFSDDGTGNSATIALTQSAAKTGAAAAGLSITPAGAGADYRAILLDGTAGTTFTGMDIIGGAVARSTPLVDVQDSSTGAGAGFNYDVLGAGSQNIYRTAVGAVLHTGDVYSLAMGATAVGSQSWVSTDARLFTAIPYSYTFSGAFATAATPAVQFTSSAAHTQTLVDILSTGAPTAAANLLAVRSTTAAFAGVLLNLSTDASAAAGSRAILATRGAYAGSGTWVSLVDGGTGTGATLATSSTTSTAAAGTVTFARTTSTASSSTLSVTQDIGAAVSSSALALTKSNTFGNAAGSTQSGLLVTMNGNALDGATAIYRAIDIASMVPNGGGGAYTALSIGSLWTTGIVLASGGIQFTTAAQDITTVNVALNVLTARTAAGAGDTLTVRAGDGNTAPNVGGDLILTSGNGAGAGAKGAIRLRVGNNGNTDALLLNPASTPPVQVAGTLQPTKRKYIPAGAFIPWKGAGFATTTNVVNAPSLTDSASDTDRYAAFFQAPYDLVAGASLTVRVDFTHTNEAAGTAGNGNVLVQAEVIRVAAGAALDGAPVYTNFAAQADGAAGLLQQTNAVAFALGGALNARDFVRIVVSRDGTAGGDTSTKVLGLLGIEIAYTANTP